MTSTLGWIGLGRIGSRMAQLLLRAGHDLIVHDTQADRVAALVAVGARAAPTPAAVAAASEAVFLSLPDADIVEAVVAGMERDTLVVDHSTISAERTREFARRFSRWVDAPVSGSPGETLCAFLGGAEADVARVAPWLAAYAKTVTHLGAVGMGQVAKSCNQAIVCTTITAWAEVLEYARRQGLDPAILMKSVAGGGAESAVRRHFAPNLLAGALAPESVRNMTKELEAIRAQAAALDLAMPVNEAVRAAYRRTFAKS